MPEKNENTATRRAHLNLIDSSRRLFEFDPGAEIEAGSDCVFGAGRSSHPVISNAAFRVDDDLAPSELLERAQEFFAARDRGFALWARSGVAADRELIEAAEKAGLRAVHEAPEMVLDCRAEDHPPPAGIELGRVASDDDARDYWRVAAEAFADNGFPPEVFAWYEGSEGFGADNVAAFLARLDGRAVGVAMAIVSDGVAGVYWVGCTAEARERGLGRFVTTTAVNAGFDMGAEIASLQASSMGEPIYRKMGFETIFNYRLLMWMPKKDGR